MIRRIQSKITLTYVLLTLVTVSAFTVIASLGTQSYLTRQKASELSRRIDAIVLLLSANPDDSALVSHPSVYRIAKALGLRLTLIDEKGEVIADSDIRSEDLPQVENHLQRHEITKAFRGEVGIDARMSNTVDQEFLYVAKLIVPPGLTGELRSAKIIRLSTQMKEIRQVAADVRSNIVLAGLFVLILVVGVSVLLSRRISTPMEEIARAVEKIRAGDLETRIDVSGEDEVGRVGRTVNEMVEKLQKDIVQLQKLERVRSEFLGNVSHELRTPLFAMQGFLETLMDGAVDDPAVNRDFLRKAYSHSVRLNTLLGDLITISHIESGEMKMSFRYFDLPELLARIVDQFQPSADNNNVRLSLDAKSPRVPQVLGDKERLRVVFENLLENAIKYNKPGGEVVVSYEQTSGKVCVKVADNGVGIPPEHVPRVFERFYRVDKARSHEVGGTGLGLAIVKHIVEAHGSNVQIGSTVEKGSVFSFMLKSS